MKRFIALISVVSIAGLLLCAAPKNKTRIKKQQVRTTAKAKKHVDETKQQTQPKEMLVKFRLEYQQAAGRGCNTSAVFSASQTEYGDYIYYREYGKYEGWSYDFNKGVCTDLMLELSRIAENKSLSSNEFTKLDDEDLTKPRWLVTMNTTDGKEYSMVEYSDGSDLLKLVESAFKPIIDKVENHELIAPYSNYHYNADGTLNYRTDHDAQGRVHGGYNPKRPHDTF